MPPPEAHEHGPSSARRSQFAVLDGGQDRIPQGAPGGGAAVERPTLAWRSRILVALAFGVAAAALVAWLLTTQPGATLGGLPADQRAALAQHTLANLRDVCRGPERPRDFCREQAHLVLQLPECEEGCQAQARAELVSDSAVR